MRQLKFSFADGGIYKHQSLISPGISPLQGFTVIQRDLFKTEIVCEKFLSLSLNVEHKILIFS